MNPPTNHNGQRKKYKRTNIDLQNVTQKTKDVATSDWKLKNTILFPEIQHKIYANVYLIIISISAYVLMQAQNES
jgi:hypothetical protein